MIVIYSTIVITTMALTEVGQYESLFNEAKHILVIFRADDQGDALCSALTLQSIWSAKGKHIDIVSDGYKTSEKFAFLPESDKVRDKLPHLQQLRVSVDLTDAGLQELSYDVQGHLLHIFITPETGFISRNRIASQQSDFRYDLIVSIGSPDIESLGEVTNRHHEMFHSVPLVNIDHATENEHFGQLNLVDVTASSCSEVVANLLLQSKGASIDQKLATTILTGMIAKTKSFTGKNIRPHTLSLASKLVSMGADRGDIIRRLYQSKSLPMLKLWGIALSNLQFNKDVGVVYTTLTRDDFVRSGGKKEDLYDIIDELIINSPDEKITVLIHEDTDPTGKIFVVLDAEAEYNAMELMKEFSPKGNSKRVSFELSHVDLKAVEKVVIETIIRKTES